jgi:Protein of unknown function (DUF3352)
MSTESDLTPAPQPDPGPIAPSVAPRPWFARYRHLLIAAGGVVALGAVSAAAVLLLVKPSATVEKMVPASQQLIVVANVDPSVSQKVNLLRAVHSFPDVKTDAAIDAKLDQVFKDSGFTFSGDIKPWLGPQVAVSAKLDLASAKNSPAAVYIASRDDTKAKAMLAKLRAGKYGTKYQWKDETYNGITISIGTPTQASQPSAAYSLVDHVVVFATTGAQIHEIIDTDQGRAARLVDSSDFKATLAGLPSDRLGYLYVNGKSLMAGVKKEMTTTPSLSLALKGLNDVDALQGIGATVSANGDGVLADVLVKLDQSKLSPVTRDALAHPGRAETIVSWVPKKSDAFLAITSLNKTIQSLLDQSGNQASVKTATDGFGLTGPGGVLPHLTGDAGLEVGFASNGIPAGAIVLGTNDAASMNAFFGKLLVLAEGAAGFGFSGSGAGSTSALQPPASHITKTTYRGVAITSWTSAVLGSLGAGALSPSYAVLDGMGILGSTPAEVKAIIDAHKDGATIASDSTYKTASAASLSRPSAIIYLDIAKLVEAIRTSPLGAQAGLKSGSALSANVQPVKAVIITATSDADKATERFFVIVR